MRVAVDVQGLTGNATGVRTYVKNLAAALGENDGGVRYDLLRLSAERIATGREARWRRAGDRLGLMAWTQMILPLQLWLGRYDVLLSPDAVTPLWTPCPRAVVVHDTYYRTRPHAYGRFWGILYRAVLEPAIRRSDVVVTVSNASHADVMRHLRVSSDRIAVVHEAPDERLGGAITQEAVAAVRERFHLGTRPYVLFVGTLEERKNVPRLIRAFARASTRLDPETALLLVGRPSWRQDDNDAVEAAIEETAMERSVLRTGFVADADLPALYAGASLLTFPSLAEGFGIPVLDAMRFGVPVVTSTAGALPEVAGQAALLVDPLDVDALAEAIVRVFTDLDLRQRLITAGRQQAARFSWTRTANEMERVLKRIAEHG